jgi:hypothetical protein
LKFYVPYTLCKGYREKKDGVGDVRGWMRVEEGRIEEEIINL